MNKRNNINSRVFHLIHYKMSGLKDELSTNRPTKGFEQYMKKCLSLEEVRLKIEGGGKISNKEERAIKYNTDRKSAILRSYVVKSIANLTYFFEFLNNHPDLIDKFSKDFEKIFGLNIPLDSRGEKAPFTRMLMEFVGKESLGVQQENLAGYLAMESQFNFRIRLLNMMQFVIKMKADWISKNLNDPPTRNDYEMSGILMEDLKRAQVWMGYLNQSVIRIPEKEKRIKPNAKTVILKAKYTEELDEKLRQELKRNKKTKLALS
jgi:hypothetical protein